MVAGGIEGQVGHLSFGDDAPVFFFKDEGDAEESTVVFPGYGTVSYYGAEQDTDESPMHFFLVYAKKKRGFRPKEAQRFSFELHADEEKDASLIVFSRRVLIQCDTAILKYQKRNGTLDGKKKWSNVLSPRRSSPRAGDSLTASGTLRTTGKGKEEAVSPKSPKTPTAAKEEEPEIDDDVYGGGGPVSPEPSPQVQEPVVEDEELSLIYEEDAMRRRDLLSSAVQTIDGLRFCGTWITNRKMFKSLVASQDEEPITLVVTRRGLCMLKPVDSILSAYHWSEIRSFGASTLPASEPMDAFVWMHKTVTYTVLLPVAEELETACNNIINQALGGTFASRPIPKYYPPSEYLPAKDTDGTVSGQMLAAKLDNKPEKWDEQMAKGESWNKKHRQFLDAVIANDLHTVMEMVKDKERLQLDMDYVDINGISPLYWAAIMGHTQVVSFLLPAGANVHARDLTGGTALHAAAYQGNQNIVSLLLKKGSDPNSRNNAGQTPLHRASVSGLPGGIVVCVGLVMSGTDVTAKDSRGNTALHLAALQGDASACEALVQTDKGREVINEGNGSGRTPLHYAVLSGRKSCVEALLIVGADRFVKDASGASSIDIARREVEDKEEREARAKSKGLVPTEGLQPAKDTLQLLLHWDPKKAGRLYKMKMMNQDVSSPSLNRRGSKMVDLKAAMEPASPASPAKAAKLNMLKGMGGKTLSFDQGSIKDENAGMKDLESDKGAVSDSLKQWESQAQALKDRIAEREKVEVEAKAASDAAAAEEAAARAEEDAAAAETAAAEAAAAEAKRKEEEEEARRKKEEEELDIDARVRVPDDAQWTDSPAVARKKKSGADADEDDGIRMWVSPKAKDKLNARPQSGVMPKHLIRIRNNRGSQVLTDDEKAMLSGDLASMIGLKEEKGSKVDLVSKTDAYQDETPEEEAARLKAQAEADERVEALRLKLQEERRQRALQRHLDEADRYESVGKYREAVDEYRMALEQGSSELAERKIDELETLLASNASRTEDVLAEIEVAAALATEMSFGFKHLAGERDGDKLKYGVLSRRENITAEELLKLTGTGGDADEWDDAEFAATLERNLDAPEEKKEDLLSKVISPHKPKERIKFDVSLADRSDSEDEKPKADASADDVWYQPSVDAPDHRTKKKKDEKTSEPRRSGSEDVKSVISGAKKAAESPVVKKKKKKTKKPAQAEPEKAAQAPEPSQPPPKKSIDETKAPAGEEHFDKKAYNAHVRKAKAFAAENNLKGALVEYEAALNVRPGHDGLNKKIKSLKKKIAADRG